MLAKAYALYFSSLAVESFYDTVCEEKAQNNHTNLPSLYALTAGLKAYTTSEALDGAEECRKMCGGHGYMVISGLPEIIGACSGACTFEGENVVMWLQVGRYLLKTFEKIAKGEEVDEQVSYLTRGVDPHTPCAAERDAFLDEDVQLEIYRSRAHRLTICLRDARDDQILMISAARAHIELSILRSFTTIIASLPSVTSPTLLSTLANLRSLFALSTIINPRTIDAQSFLTTHSPSPYLSSAQLDAIRSLVNSLLATLLPDAIRLTDAWDFSDASLGSALGCSDGDVYGRIMKWVGEMPINKNVDDIHAGWGEFMGAIVKAKL
jgi:acyl-CoA oxidase